MPKPYNKENGFEIKMCNLNGTITTPWFGGDYVEEYYKQDRVFHMVLELPGDIKDQLGNGSLIIELEVDTREETGWIEDVFMFTYNYTLHTTWPWKNWFEAEAECQRGGGHLASATSEEVNQMLKQVADKTMTGGNFVWLGGRKEFGEWSWSDISPGDTPSGGILGRKVTQTAVVSKPLMGGGMGSGMPILVQRSIGSFVKRGRP